jgi:ubiquinone biosynthesis protein UbiJ
VRLALEPAIVGVVNHLLAAQSWARSRLVVHAGDSIRLEVGPTVIEVAVTAEGLLEPAADRAPAVTILVPLSALPRLLARDAQARRQVGVTGNVALAADIEYLFANLRWDVEGDMSRVIGDIAAHRVAQAGAVAARWPREVAGSLARSSRQFLTEEQPVLVRPAEVGDFVDGIDRLRDDVERLDKRLSRLEAAAGSRS